MLSFSLKARDSLPPNLSRTEKPSAKRLRASSRKLVSAEQLAGSVERSIEHQDAERALADLRRKRKAVREQLASAGGFGTSEVERRLFLEERNIERRIHMAAHELIPMREAHGRRVETALQPERQAAAAAVLAALAEAETALARLNELNATLRLVGRATPALSKKPLMITRLQVEDVVRKGEAARWQG